MAKKSKKSKKAEKKVDLRTLPHDKRPEPTSGQHGKPIHIGYAELNVHEQRVVKALDAAEGAAMRIPEIAKSCSARGGGKTVTTLQVRNAMRRLVRGSWVDSRGRGQYRLTTRGRDRYESATKSKATVTPVRAKKEAAPKKEAKPKKPKAEKPAKVAGKPIKVEMLNPAYTGRIPKGMFEDSDDIKTAVLVLALFEIEEYSYRKLTKLTGLSRSFVLPRLNHLRVYSVLSGPRDLKSAVDKAQGVRPGTAPKKADPEPEATETDETTETTENV
jgi:hypothetical protein